MRIKDLHRKYKGKQTAAGNPFYERPVDFILFRRIVYRKAVPFR